MLESIQTVGFKVGEEKNDMKIDTHHTSFESIQKNPRWRLIRLKIFWIDLTQVRKILWYKSI